ncbi:MAG TPA: EF-hand domain-containing protein, partial [Polyangiales bacterium]|nr:EF-hand domain-containing protein [Polyangiales bacterium]
MPSISLSSQLALATVLEQLRRASAGGGVDARAVQKALALRSEYLAQRLLTALGGSERGFATPEAFVEQATKVMQAKAEDKLGFLFRLHDEDGDGWIHRDELDRLLHVAVAEHELKLSGREVDELVAGVMGVGDRDADNRISLIEFTTMMMAHPEIQQQLANYGVSMLMPGKRARSLEPPPHVALRGWMRNDLALAVCAVLYGLANALLFADAFLRYRSDGANLYVQIARGCGACLNFNGALIAVPMLRHTLTWVRRSLLGRIVPVDDAVA